MQTKITIIEPQMDSFGHAQFNASFIHSLLIAFPDSQVSFVGKKNHVTLVKQDIFKNSTSAVDNLTTQSLQPPNSGRALDRWLWSWRLFSNHLDHSGRLVLTSASRMHIIQLQILTFFLRGPRPTIVLHGDLETLLCPPKSFSKYMLSMAYLLKRKAVSRLKYFVLGQSILENIPREYKQLTSNCHVIDLPYHFLQPTITVAKTPVFGVFGNSGDGRILYELISSVHSKAPNVKFLMVGFVASEQAVNLLSPHVLGVTKTPLSREEYEKAAGSITHSLFLTKAGGYRLRASGALFDVMSFLKPMLFMSNPFVEHYWKQCPELGICCTDISDMADKVIALSNGFSEKAYLRQQAVIYKFREKFTPAAQAFGMVEALSTP